MLKPDGSCVNLTSEGLCGIYETRPVVCRIDGLYDASKLIRIGVEREDWHDFVVRTSCLPSIMASGEGGEVPPLNFDSPRCDDLTVGMEMLKTENRLGIL